jgi:hypothetical protein
MKLFSLDERLIPGELGHLAAIDRCGVQANLCHARCQLRRRVASIT